MKRFWFEFEMDDISKYPGGIGYGCGVRAIDYDDAINILKQKVFKTIPIPRIRKQIEDVNINDLDQGHVVVNMDPPNYRGVWFPRGYNY
jgi:hypothetical protein